MSRKHRNRNLSEKISLEIPLKIEKLAPTGQGIGTLESGKKIFLWNTLPGEKVLSYLKIKEKSSFEEGIAETFEKTASSRIVPKDAQYLATSPWQIMTDDFEAEQKTAIMTELFHNLWHEKIPFHQSPNTWHYRNKMEYSLYRTYC